MASVPNTSTFTLQDVYNSVSSHAAPAGNLQSCFDNAVASYFDPTYNTDSYAPANSMLRFRNYTPVTSVLTPDFKYYRSWLMASSYNYTMVGYPQSDVQAGDYAVVVVQAIGSNVDWTTPSGWTLVAGNVTDSTFCHKTFVKVLDGTEDNTTFNITMNKYNTSMSTMYTVRGASSYRLAVNFNSTAASYGSGGTSMLAGETAVRFVAYAEYVTTASASGNDWTFIARTGGDKGDGTPIGGTIMARTSRESDGVPSSVSFNWGLNVRFYINEIIFKT